MIKMALRKLLGTLGAIVLAAGLAAGCGKADTGQKRTAKMLQQRQKAAMRRQKQKAAMQRQMQKAAGRNQMPRKQKPLPLKWKFFRKQFLWIRTASR